MSVFFTPDPQTSESPPVVKTKRFTWLRRLAAVVAVLVVVGVAASAIYVGTVSQSFTSNIHRVDDLPPAIPTDSGQSARPPAKTNTGSGNTHAIDYVLMGSDSRDAAHPGAGRSDTLMVLHLTADRKAAYLISFPRDMYVAIPGRGKNKINAAFAFGGPQLTIRTLEGLLDTRMDHVVLVDFDGFINLTQELGGVTVYNKYASKSRGYSYPKGNITIEGTRALDYVRERYELPNGDLDRAERQRNVVQAILKKGLSGAEIRSTALSLRLTGDDVLQLQAPISGFATVRGMDVDVVDRGKLAELAKDLREDHLDAYLVQHPVN
jgi:LCP family protein required for cell wall assembly